MSMFQTAYHWLTGWATRQGRGTQQPVPSTVAFSDTRPVSLDSALQVSTVWACVKLLSETIASLPIELYMRDEEDKLVLAKRDQLYMVLHSRPNDSQTAQEFWEYMLLNQFLRGNAYARIIRNTSGETVALRPMSADQVEVQRLDDGSIVYVYSVDSKRFIFLEADVLHIRTFGTDTVGLSPLDYMRGSVSLAISAQSHTNKTYQKNARRPGLLMSDNVLKPEQREALKRNFSEIVTGGEKELYVLEAGFNFEALGMTPADLQLLETRKFATEDVARFFGVPSVLINDDSATSTWGSGIQQIVEGFYKFTIRPAVERIEQSLHRKVLTPRQRSQGYKVEFNLDALLRANAKDRMDIYSKAVQNGIFTRNECRVKENQPPMEGGDILTAQVNLAPLDALGKVPTRRSTDVAQDPINQ